MYSTLMAHYNTHFSSADVKEEFLTKPPSMDYTTTFKGDFTKGIVVYWCNINNSLAYSLDFEPRVIPSTKVTIWVYIMWMTVCVDVGVCIYSYTCLSIEWVLF